MDENDPKLESALEGVDEDKRSTLSRLILGGSFMAPIVASFAMGGLSIDALAQTRNSTGNLTATTASGRQIIAPVTSDRRLKVGIARVGTHPAGFGLYRFRFPWSDVELVGVLAQEVLDVMPAAVVQGEDGFLRVDYAALGTEMVPYALWSESRTI